MFFEKEVNSPLRNVLERQPTKKGPNVFNFEISKFFCAKDPFKKDVQQIFFCKTLRLYHHLQHVVDCEIESMDHKSYEICNLNMFEMIVNTSELIKKLVNRELLIFKRFQVDPKEIKCPL
jgi:hypothetical protein